MQGRGSVRALRVIGALCVAWACGMAQAAIGVCMAPGLGGGLLAAGGLTSSLAGSLLGAQTSPVACMPDEPASLPVDQPARLLGNPVDAISGAKLDRAVDVPPSRRSEREHLLVFTRLYASDGPGSDAFGPGWRHGFETRLHLALQAPGETALQVVQADGRVVRFARQAQRTKHGEAFAAWRRDDGVLEPPTDRGGPWRWHWRDGRVLTFRADGRLVGLARPGQASLALAYDANDRLVSVVGSDARAITLRHAPIGVATQGATAPRAVRVVEVVGPGGARRYAYDREGRLAVVDHPDGRRVAYAYDARGRLASVTLPDGAASEYRYDAAGRVVYSRPAGRGAHEALSLHYRRDPEGLAGETEVAQEGVVRARYRWASSTDGEPRLVESDGSGCADCPPTGVRYGHDRFGLASITHAGWHVIVQRDPAGRLVGLVGTAQAHALAVAPRGGPVALRGSAQTLLRIDWTDDPWYDRPRRLSRPSIAPGRSHALDFAYDDRSGRTVLTERGFAPVVVPRSTGAEVRGYRPVRREWRADRLPPGVQEDGPLALPADAVEAGAGRWRHVAGNGATTRYWRDDLGRTVAIESPDSGLSRWQRDDAGRLVAEVIADGSAARYGYDAAGRLVVRALSDARGVVSTTRYRHGPHGLEAVQHPGRDERYDYDDRGRLVRRTVEVTLDGGRRTRIETRYRYDRDSGALAARTLPDGSWLHLVRDPAGQVIALRRARAGGAEDPGAGALLIGDMVRDATTLARATLGNGAQVSVTRDAGSGIVQLCDRSASSAACDLLDHRLALDADGRLRRWQRGDEATLHLFDEQGRLLQAYRTGRGTPQVWRFAWDANGNLERSQAPLPSGAASRAIVAARADGTNRPVVLRERRDEVVQQDPGRPTRLAWDVAGRLIRQGDRYFRWGADGLLAEVGDAHGVLARYGYDHRGARAWSRHGTRVIHHLQDELRQPLAELDGEGRLLRQYVYLADRPVAVIDPIGEGERIAFLHLNHLGAPEAATDAAARVVWRASYAPFGRRIDGPSPASRPGGASAPAFDLRLRLPGQLEDPATGLHYNDHREYDPDAGRYLSPDPLGLRGGPNPYAYADNDPTTRIDPTGLVLFAFDGTGNGDPPPRRDDWSNVYKLARSYGDGRVWYMAGVGQPDAGSGIAGNASDPVTAYTARARVDWMLAQLDQAVASPQARGRWVDVDVIGFSRGAAMGRDFVNRIADRIADRAYERLGACVRLRFLGLWDTVAQFGVAGAGNFLWRLPVPAAVAYTAHAVALNEHRMLFPGESVLGGPFGGVRIERGFIGAHSDVGGSYPEGDLSDVALNWMHRHATLAGVRMFALTADLMRVSAPLLHDSRTLVDGDREFRYRSASGGIVANPSQRVAPVGGMQWRDTARFVRRYATPIADAYGDPTIVGAVDIAAYADWLGAHYGIRVSGGP